MTDHILDLIRSEYQPVKISGELVLLDRLPCGFFADKQQDKITLRFDGSSAEDKPLVILTEGNYSLRIELAKGAFTKIIEIINCDTDTTTDIILNENSKLNLTRIQTSKASKTQLTCTQKDHSSLTLSTVSLSGDNQNSFHIFCSEGTHTKLSGLGISDANEKLTNTIRLYHQKAYAESFQTFRYIVAGESTATFDGKIIVEPNAQKIQAYQKNNNILLSTSATVHSDPQLEIYADDVKCSHGSTVGQLDQNAMFYMQSRGIPYPIAKSMLIRSFADQTLEDIPDKNLVEAIEKLIDRKLK